MEKISVKPRIVDGVEFYITPDGSECGMSQSGLARLCGVARATLRALLDYLENPDNPAAGKTHLKSLEPLRGKIYLLPVTGDKGAKIVRDEACAAIIEYYAFESKRGGNETAIYSYRQFAKMGIRSWIKSVCDFNETETLARLENKIQLLLEKYSTHEEILQAHVRIRYRTATTYPRLDEMLDDLNDLPQQVLSHKPLTLKEWLIQQHVVLNSPDRLRPAHLAAATIKSTTGADTLRNAQHCCLYTADQFPVLEMCLKKILGE